MPPEGRDTWIRPDGEHKGLPVWTGNTVESFECVRASYIRDYVYDPPTALEPDKPDNQGDFRYEYRASVYIECSSDSTIYSLNILKPEARKMYRALRLLFGGDDD